MAPRMWWVFFVKDVLLIVLSIYYDAVSELHLSWWYDKNHMLPRCSRSISRQRIGRTFMDYIEAGCISLHSPCNKICHGKTDHKDHLVFHLMHCSTATFRQRTISPGEMTQTCTSSIFKIIFLSFNLHENCGHFLVINQSFYPCSTVSECNT